MVKKLKTYFIPVVNCGLCSGNIPEHFLSQYDHRKVGFQNGLECYKWIENNRESFSENELGGCIYPYRMETLNPHYIDCEGNYIKVEEVDKSGLVTLNESISKLQDGLNDGLSDYLREYLVTKNGKREVFDILFFVTLKDSSVECDKEENNFIPVAEVSSIYLDGTKVMVATDSGVYGLEELSTSGLVDLLGYCLA